MALLSIVVPRVYQGTIQHHSTINKDLTMATCKTCNGKGSVKCPKCKGRGRIQDLLGGSHQCNNCNGSGVVKCGVCNGKGHV